EPDVLLKHAIREMDEELARTQQRVRQLEHESETLAERQRKVQTALAELVSQLDVCISNTNDELARKVMKRKLETEKRGQHGAARSAGVAKELAEHRGLVDEQRERLDVLRQKAELLAATPTGGGDEWGRASFAVSEDEVEVALLRERQAR